jgi:hypothetical protein
MRRLRSALRAQLRQVRGMWVTWAPDIERVGSAGGRRLAKSKRLVQTACCTKVGPLRHLFPAICWLGRAAQTRGRRLEPKNTIQFADSRNLGGSMAWCSAICNVNRPTND